MWFFVPMGRCREKNLRQEAKILEFKAKIKALKEEKAKLRERAAQLEARLRLDSFKRYSVTTQAEDSPGNRPCIPVAPGRMWDRSFP